MHGRNRLLAYLLIVSMLYGCAASSSKMINDGYSLSDTRICRNYLNDYSELKANPNLTTEERNYFLALDTQVRNRGLSTVKCEDLVSDSNATAIAIGALVVITAVALAASGGGGSSGGGSYGYAWDQFYDGNYNLVWRCRNKANGQFAYDSSCSTAYKTDSTWPEK